MSADDFLHGLSEVLFLALALVTLRAALRHPVPFRFNTALFFGAAAAVILVGDVASLLPITAGYLNLLVSALLMALPYLLLRLVDGFAGLPRWSTGAAAAGLAASVLALALAPTPTPPTLALFLVLYYIAVVAYATVGAVREARRSSGVTQRRLQAIAGGSLLLGFTILAAGLVALAPALRTVWTTLSVLSGLASGLAYYLGFAPPLALRRAWQEPELRAFLADAARLPHLEDAGAIVRALERGAAAALGVPSASIGMWNEAVQSLQFRATSGDFVEISAGDYIGGRAFAAQRAMYSSNAAADDPAHATRYRSSKATAVLAAPITAGSERLGVLTAYASQPPVFAEDDLDLIELLARQAAVILDYLRLFEASRRRAEEIERLYDDARKAQQERELLAREQTARAEAEAAVRARDEFLFVAAHELRTPITGLRGFVQLLLRQLDRRGSVEPSRLREALRTIDEQSAKMTLLISQLLDVSRLSTDKLTLERRRVDILPIIEGVLTGARLRSPAHTMTLDAPPMLLAEVDGLRFEQAIVNLVDNAVKYSPDGGAIEVVARQADVSQLQIQVRDHGVGIPAERRARIFDRFYQAHDSATFGGMGLGLFITRQIVESHEGTIAVSFPDGGGTCFTITMPAVTAALQPSDATLSAAITPGS